MSEEVPSLAIHHGTRAESVRFRVAKMRAAGAAEREAAIRSLASRLRPADAREAWAAGGRTPEEVVRESLDCSLAPGGRGRAWAVLLAGQVEMLFGVAPFSLLSDVGVPWMLATDAWDEAVAGGLDLAFARRCRRYAAEMGRGFARLENHVHAGNRKAIRWLKWLGFRFDPPGQWGVRGEMFMKFWMECVPVPAGRGAERHGENYISSKT